MKRRAGISLVELIVVAAIISVLGSLIFVGVQAVRVQARMEVCKSRLNQHCLAMINYESANMHLPYARWQYDLMPYLELEVTRNGMDRGKTPADLNQFHCPSDTLLDNEDNLFGNFLACSGTWMTENGQDGVVCSRSSEFPGGTAAVTISQITDGLSSTAFISEGIAAKNQDRESAKLGVIWTLPGHSYALDELDEFTNACLAMPPDPAAAGFMGNQSTKGNIFQYIRPTNYAPVVGLGHNLYNHAAPPQTNSCKNGSNTSQAIIPPSSGHHGVANVGFCDGHVQGFSKDVDLKLWRQLGSKSTR